MWTYEHSVTATADPTTVWGCYADPAVWPEWDAEVRHLRLDGPFATGVTGTLSLQHLPPMAITVTEVRPGTSFSTEVGTPDGAVIRFTYGLEPVDDHTTRITHRVEIHGSATPRETGQAVAAPVPDTMASLARLAASRVSTSG